jgi:hypothetical protein
MAAVRFLAATGHDPFIAPIARDTTRAPADVERRRVTALARRSVVVASGHLLGRGYKMLTLTTPIVIRSRFGRAWEVTSDLLIATALIWTLPLLIGAAAALIELLVRAM